jgi:hypothetical protein
VIGGHAVVVSKYLRPSAHEPSSMGQPRELRGDRRRHASPVKRLTQAKTTGSLIQPSLPSQHGYNECRACQDKHGESTDLQIKLQHQEHGSSRPRGSGNQLARSTGAAEVGSDVFPIEAASPSSLPRANSGVRDASVALSCTPADYVLDHGSGIRTETEMWAQIGPNQFMRDHIAVSPCPSP